jgi:hypothetical protein
MIVDEKSCEKGYGVYHKKLHLVIDNITSKAQGHFYQVELQDQEEEH